MRYRVKFSKTEAMRFTGNLDLHRTLERTMRRANLPLSYSQGFNPRPKLTLASALPLGYTSEHEAADFWLKEEMGVQEIEAVLMNAAPPGIIFHKVEEVDPRAPKLQTTITSSNFLVTLLDHAAELDRRVDDLMACGEISIEKIRKGKKRVYDLRELIVDMKTLPQGEEGSQRIEMLLRAGEGMTGRPDDVLRELGIDPLKTLVHRTRINFK
jgi:radical SAM-linked protein